MNPLTKMALGLLGRLHGQPASGEVLDEMALPPAQTTGGLPLMDALQRRQSQREFRPEALAPHHSACASVETPVAPPMWAA